MRPRVSDKERVPVPRHMRGSRLVDIMMLPNCGYCAGTLGQDGVEVSGELVALIDRAAPHLVGRPHQRLPDAALDRVARHVGIAAGWQTRDPAGKPSRDLGDRFLAAELDLVDRRPGALVELIPELRFQPFEAEPRDARVL